MQGLHRFDWGLKGLFLIFASGWLIFVGFRNEIPADVGDGLMHFFYSQASWETPDYFLHHWGKPFFILLSSPFAQFGFNGMIVFNVLVFMGSVLMGYRIMSHFKVNVWIQCLFPLVLLTANELTATLVSGLTEPLFNLAVIVSAWMLINKKFMWFALIVSLMPFMRSEGQLPLLLALILLVWNRSFSSIPWLFFGFIIYGIAGIFVYGDFWWYFTLNPYSMANDIYGSGSWDHYLISYRGYLGNPGLYVMIVGFLATCFLLLKKRWQELQLEWSFYTHGIFLGVVVAHSYFWATGTNGSMGLTRIATQGMPLFVLLYLYYVSRIPWFTNKVSILFGIGSVAMCVSLFNSKHFPVKARLMEKEIIAAADFLEKNSSPSQKIYYHYPLLVYELGENPFKKGNRMVFTYFHHLEDDLGKVIKPGSFIVWDSHFGPVEAGLPLEKMETFSELVKVEEFIFAEKEGKPEGVIIYQFIPEKYQVKNLSKETVKIDIKKIDIPAEKEFIDILPMLPAFNKTTKISLDLIPETEGLILVFDRNGGAQYVPNDLKKGVVNSFSFNVPGVGEKALYIWNKEFRKSGIKVEKIEMTEQGFHPVMK